MSERGVAPVVGKLLEVGVVLLFMGVLSASMFGVAVPEYRAVTADRLADRSLAAGAHAIEGGIADSGTVFTRTVRRSVPLPRTIAGETYRLRIDGRTLTLVHPDGAIRRSVTLAVPDDVERLTGAVESGADGIRIELERTEAGISVVVSGWSE